MSHGPEQHIEHAEHASHAVLNRFDKQVTISIAIIAAVLACVTMLAHRAHNETLRLQNLASMQTTETSNKWSYYQSKNQLNSQGKVMLNLLSILATKDGSEAASEKLRTDYQGIVDKYEKKLPEIEAEAREIAKKGDEFREQSHAAHARADRFDYGELGLQLAVVLCSLAILTKGRGFWYAGIVSGILGLLIALTSLVDLFPAGH
jgi:hypothetical protein